jgi:hypothetical protein
MAGDGTAPGAVAPTGPELHVVVIWSAARGEQNRILADLQHHLEVCGVHEVSWSPELVRQNYARFYRGRLVPPYRNVRLRKGKGPHLVVTALDRTPRYAMRETLHGPAVVNTTLFDAKIRYRAWTGPGHLVHGSDTAAEAGRDLMLLLGFAVDDYLATHPGAWDGAIQPVRHDLSGARGWASPEQLFAALNCSVDYVVLHGLERLLGDEQSSETIELLTSNYIELIAVTNARPLLRQIPRWGGAFVLRIAGRDAVVGIRFIGDRYFDPAWQRAVLERRELCRDGCFVPATDDAFETLAYHLLIHTRSPSERDKKRLTRLARAVGRPEWTHAALDDPRQARTLLDGVLRARGHILVRPRDPLAFYNFRLVGASCPAIRHALADLRSIGTKWCHLGSAHVRGRYFAARDGLARAAPWIRRLLPRSARPRPGFQAPTARDRSCRDVVSSSPAVTGGSK